MPDIKNGDMPANPLRGANNCIFDRADVDFFDRITIGLTKREAFAMAAMQGLIANSALRGSTEECSKSAVDYADSLLKELAK
jgi:hypothetical protein